MRAECEDPGLGSLVVGGGCGIQQRGLATVVGSRVPVYSNSHGLAVVVPLVSGLEAPWAPIRAPTRVP